MLSQVFILWLNSISYLWRSAECYIVYLKLKYNPTEAAIRFHAGASAVLHN